MEIRIVQIGADPAVRLAAKELSKYLPKIDPAVETAILLGNETLNGIKVGMACGENGELLVPASELDDEIMIDVKNGKGVITGSNARSVLIAAYRFLREAGCRWVRPGESGEKILPGDVGRLSVSIRERASYRHRGVCVEGDCSYNHVLQMIEWMPKIGLNAYFHQFFVPYTFFEKWYLHGKNPEMEPQPTSVEEVSAMVESSIASMKERGMMFHQVGHGWTCEPFGVSGHGWDPKEYHLTEEQAAPFALVNGKRDVWKGVGLNTNLCYSNPSVRKTLVEAIVDYAKKHPQVDYLHFWLADESRNQCECDGCKDTRPSDFYVQMLNDVDRRLTEEKINTKIVFLIYLDLLWVPERERIVNHDRFALMFAPISRTYSETFLEASKKGDGQLQPYLRNRNVMSTKVEDNIAYLREWQKSFSGDAFDYDYHMLWDWNFDLGGYRSSEVLFEDMKDLHQFGINGMMSCQMQRVAFPTALGMVGMASALWDEKASFREVSAQYFGDLFGESAEAMKEYFQTLSELFHPPYLRLEEETINPERAEDYRKLSAYIDSKKQWLFRKKEAAENACDRATWNIVARHADICSLMAAALEYKASGNQKAALEQWNRVTELANHLEAAEPHLRDAWDVEYFLNIVGGAVKGEKRPGIDY